MAAQCVHTVFCTSTEGIQIHNFQIWQGNSNRRLTTQAKKSRTYRVLFPLIDYTEVIGMYNEKPNAPSQKKLKDGCREDTCSSTMVAVGEALTNLSRKMSPERLFALT
jgi:hypothetical protein